MPKEEADKLLDEEEIKFSYDDGYEAYSTKKAFEGVVIGKKNRGLNSAFILRKISHGVGVERTFQAHSPLIESITVKRRGDVRKAKLYYLRERSGRSARIKEKLK